MEQPILVINRIGTLRRLTVQILKNLGYRNLIEVENLAQAESKIRSNNDSGIILLELGGTWLKTPVFDFLDAYGDEGWNQRFRVIATAEVHDTMTMRQLREKGVEEIIIQTFNLNAFSDALARAISSQEPELAN